jgi:hypothetical protein
MTTETQENGRRSPYYMSRRSRWALGIIGLMSWAAGGVASFIGASGAGAASLVLVGLISAGLGLIGRWPSRISMSGSEFAWEEVKATVETQIEVAEESGEGSAVIAELKVLEQRLELLRQTGSVAEHPAEAYDRAVEAAIHRLYPDASIVASELRSRTSADFSVTIGKLEFLLETKWRPDPARPFRGSTIPSLISHLPVNSLLLVVVNADVMTEEAVGIVANSLGTRGQIVSWRDVRDDPKLASAVSALS